jgi:uncharacterized damage-inducible protein DinB
MPERTLIELLYGEGAHANTLACVEDAGFEVAGRLAHGFSHSIWQLVNHMNFWMAYELKRIQGEMPVYPAHASESWPARAHPPSEEEWRKIVALYRDLLAELAKLAKSPPDLLARPVSATHPDHTRHSSSVVAVLWQMVVHNSYHIGQVVLLRHALGEWPPKGGGDSW